MMKASFWFRSESSQFKTCSVVLSHFGRRWSMKKAGSQMQQSEGQSRWFQLPTSLTLQVNSINLTWRTMRGPFYVHSLGTPGSHETGLFTITRWRPWRTQRSRKPLLQCNHTKCWNQFNHTMQWKIIYIKKGRTQCKSSHTRWETIIEMKFNKQIKMSDEISENITL